MAFRLSANEPAPTKAMSRNAKQNSTVNSPPFLNGEQTVGLVLGEVGVGHCSGAQQGGYPGEQTEQHQHADDELDESGVPVRPGAGGDGTHLGDRPPEQLGAAVQGERQTDDDAEDAEHGGGVRCRDGRPGVASWE